MIKKYYCCFWKKKFDMPGLNNTNLGIKKKKISLVIFRYNKNADKNIKL